MSLEGTDFLLSYFPIEKYFFIILTFIFIKISVYNHGSQLSNF